MKWIFITLLSLCISPGIAQRNHYTIDQIQIVAPAKASQATLQRVVIDTTLLKAFQSVSLSELLAQNSPVNIKSYGRGDVQNATFRGTAPSHTLVHWNGVRINSPMIGAVDFGQIPLFFVDKLSVDAGVSSMMVASGALGGAVNIESQPQWDKKFSLEALQTIGSFTSTDSYLKIVAGNRAFQSSTKLFYTYSKNDFSFINQDIIDPTRPDFRPKQRNENGDYHRSGFMQEFFARLDSTQTLTAVVWGLNSNSNLPQLTTYEGDQSNNLTDRRDESLRAAITYKRYGKKVNWTGRFTGDLQSMGFNQRNRTGAGYQNTIQSSGLSRSIGLNIAASLNFFRHHTIDINANGIVDYVNSDEKVKNIGYEKSRAEYSVMGALYSTWGRRFASSVAIRGSVVGSQAFVTPFIGGQYLLTDSWSIKARVGYNVHQPSISDLYYVPGGNVDLLPEEGITAEIGTVYGRENTKIELNLFSSWIDNWIIWLPSHQQYWTPQNMRKVLSQGVELSGSNLWTWGDWSLYGSLNFTLNRTTNIGEPMVDGDQSIGKQLVYVPLVSGGMFTKVTWRQTWLSYQIHGESERHTTTSNNQSVQSTIAPYTLSDITAGYTWRMLTVELKCRNIFDSKYYTVLRRPLPGRSVEALLRIKI